MNLNEHNIELNQTFNDKNKAIRRAGELLVESGSVSPEYIEAMLEREQIVSTHMGNFVAIPHGTDEAKKHVRSTGISVIQVPFGVDFSENPNEEKMAMMIFGIAGVGDEHLELLSKIAVLCSELDNVVKLVNAKDKAEIIQLIEGVDL
ncbi:PTS sugar transporter subunit IIA [Ignavigranum ruoffiae]|uniref:Mannitol-specific phosphotransferase enzyme IIA component n=1 Tax=Ignavigranum ruoffiae TaxID=89093 RepID=A0A1H9DDV9_9LACT|nr:PTS sugar transporter subunit IIA [Ignavigranum ruoffiae]SEQ11685.1 PTS system D-mannitol-specific IIA component, Fru family [Ignavigranum ruoffiae]